MRATMIRKKNVTIRHDVRWPEGAGRLSSSVTAIQKAIVAKYRTNPERMAAITATGKNLTPLSDPEPDHDLMLISSPATRSK
jgi:hypothetical protein